MEPLPVNGVIFVQDHDVDRQTPQPPVRVRPYDLAYQIDIGRVSDPLGEIIKIPFNPNSRRKFYDLLD